VWVYVYLWPSQKISIRYHYYAKHVSFYGRYNECINILSTRSLNVTFIHITHSPVYGANKISYRSYRFVSTNSFNLFLFFRNETNLKVQRKRRFKTSKRINKFYILRILLLVSLISRFFYLFYFIASTLKHGKPFFHRFVFFHLQMIIEKHNKSQIALTFPIQCTTMITLEW
jgi:hypothetical protein